MVVFKKILVVSLILLTVFFVTLAYGAAWEQKNTITYFGTTDNNVVVLWDADLGSTVYDIALYHVEQEMVVLNLQTENTEIVFKLPKSGHYIVRIRGCSNLDMSLCGEWSESTDPVQSTVESTVNGWWVYGYVAPVGQIIIQ